MQEKSKGYLYVFLAGCCWGLIGIFTNGLGSLGLDSVAISMMRQACSTIVMLFIVAFSCGFKALKVDKKTMLLLIILGAVIEASFNLFYTLAIRTVGIATGVVLLYSSPIFVSIMSRIFFSESLGKFKIIALILNVIGCTLTATGGDFSAMSFSVVGIFYGVMAGFTYALVTIFGKWTTEAAHPFVVTFYLSLYSFIVLLVIVLFRGFPMVCLSAPGLLYGFGDGLVATAIPYALYMSGMKKPVEAGTASVVASVEVVVGSLVGILVFQEKIPLLGAMGILVVIASIVLMNKSN